MAHGFSRAGRQQEALRRDRILDSEIYIIEGPYSNRGLACQWNLAD